MRGKPPAMMFYVSDWLGDPAVGACSPATRGIWFDWLCGMWRQQTGSLEGSISALARVGRCSDNEALFALRELVANDAADVTCNANVTLCNADVTAHVTLVNRRMTRDLSARESTKHRVAKFRKHKSNADCNENVTPPSSVACTVTGTTTPLKAKASCDSGESAQDTKKANSPSLVGHKGKTIHGEALEGFNRFWEAFDYKHGKAQAISSWHEVYKNRGTSWESHLEQIIAGAYRAAGGRKDILDRGSTPMMAQGWLTARRWEDGPALAPGPPRDRGVVSHAPVAIGPMRRPDFSRFDKEKEKDGTP